MRGMKNGGRSEGGGQDHESLLLGHGREGTFVYVARRLTMMHSNLLGVCLWRYASPPVPRHHKAKPRKPAVAGGGVTAALRHTPRKDDHETEVCTYVVGNNLSHFNKQLYALGFTERVAIKDIPNSDAACRECHRHALAHKWFTEAGAIEWTPLCPDLACADVLLQQPSYTQPVIPRWDTTAATTGESSSRLSNLHRRRLLLYRRLGKSGFAIRPQPAARILRMARDVLRALTVIHAHDTLHMDIKPDNVLEDDDGFVLADYGLMASKSAAVSHVKNKLPTGTVRFMSPLLLTDDFENNVYAIFQDAATTGGAPAAPPGMPLDAWWSAYFTGVTKQVARRTARVFKLDLQSLALTLIDMFREHNEDTPPVSVIQEAHAPLFDLIARLLLCRPQDDHWTAAAALQDADHALTKRLR